MRTATYETESAIFHFDLPDVLAILNVYVTKHGVGAAIKIQKSIESSTEDSIKIPPPYFGYMVLDLLRKGKGTVFCKTCQKTYQPAEQAYQFINLTGSSNPSRQGSSQ